MEICQTRFQDFIAHHELWIELWVRGDVHDVTVESDSGDDKTMIISAAVAILEMVQKEM